MLSRCICITWPFVSSIATRTPVGISARVQNKKCHNFNAELQKLKKKIWGKICTHILRSIIAHFYRFCVCLLNAYEHRTFISVQYCFGVISNGPRQANLCLRAFLTAHAQPFRGTRDLAFCLKAPLGSLLVRAISGGSGETARMRRLA